MVPTPAIVPAPGGVELVTNAPRAIRGYHPATGMELWSLKPSSNITAPTPVFSGDLIVVGSGRRPGSRSTRFAPERGATFP